MTSDREFLIDIAVVTLFNAFNLGGFFLFAGGFREAPLIGKIAAVTMVGLGCFLYVEVLRKR